MVKNTTFSEIRSKRVQSVLAALSCFNKATLSSIIDKKGEGRNYWVKRLIQLNEITTIKNGLFVGRTFVLKLRPEELQQYREYLASVLRHPSYLSLEYVLAKQGALTEMPLAITSVTNKSSRVYENEFGSYIFQNIKEPLFCGYSEEFFREKRYFVAKRAKALFDFVYLRTFNARIFEKDLEEGLRINWDAFEKTDLKEIKTYSKIAGKKKMDRFVNIVIKKNLL